MVRRIDRLEHALGMRLFNRAPDGVVLTAEGHSVLSGVKKMEVGSFDVLQSRLNAALDRTAVTISITEGLGSYWMMPQIVQFQRQHPAVVVAMHCAMESADVLRLEADMAIQFIKPASPDLMVVRLGRMHVYPFASRGYLERYGTPHSAAEMRQHRLVNQVAPQLDPGAWARHLGMESVEEIVGVSTNASTAILYAIDNDAGIGALPTYVATVNRRIVPVDIDVIHQMDIWLTFRRDLRETKRRAFLIDWIRSIFDPRAHPYFGEEFIHPTELRRMVPQSVWQEE
jgi:DNA-binding transcriptional LysR family regulator